MKKAALLVIVLLALAVCIPAFAQQFPDVPTDHWAYAAVQNLADAGIVQGYPDGTFGGKRALTRYEFAEALSKAIPVIAQMVKGEIPTPPAVTPPAPTPAPAPTGFVTQEQLANLQRLVDEFGEELKAQGADIDALKRDIAALTARVVALEEEQRRVVITGEADMIFYATVNNKGLGFDRDSRLLGTSDKLLEQSRFFNDFELGIKGRVSNDVSVKALIGAGNYLDRTDGPLFSDEFSGVANNEFTLWNLYMDANMKLIGNTQIRAGRMPLQLTPLTLKFVDPDSYTYLAKTDSGDFPVDGASAGFGFGKNLSLTVFGAKTADQGEFTQLIQPSLMIPGVGGIGISQFAGARAVVGTGFLGNVGLTYLQAGLLGTNFGQNRIYGADINTSFSSIGVSAEYAKTDPTDTMRDAVLAASGNNVRTKDNAWNAKLSANFGGLGVAGGYGVIERNYDAPGYWSRFGRAVNLQNVKGPMANLSYAFGKNLSLVAEGQWLQPNQDGFDVTGRTAVFQGDDVLLGNLDKLNYYRAGLKFGLTSSNSVDLGWEEVQWDPTAGSTTKERYVSLGVGHSFNANSSLKLLYQIVEYEQGGAFPYFSSDADYRGGVAAAQFQLKY